MHSKADDESRLTPGEEDNAGMRKIDLRAGTLFGLFDYLINANENSALTASFPFTVPLPLAK